MTDLYINGRFTLQRTTGVQRVGREIVSALDRKAAADPSTPCAVVLMPPRAKPLTLRRVGTRVVDGPWRPQLWEQWALPRAARGGLLLNLCGAAPALSFGSQACVIHDAAVFDHPEAYADSFVRWYRWLFRSHARRGSRLITVSRFSQGRLAGALGVPLERIAVVPLAADHMARVTPDPSVLHRHGLVSGGFLLAVGSANPTKRLHLLVQAWRALGRRDIQLAIAGGSSPGVFSSKALPRAQGVVELGPVDDPALKALYEAAVGLVFPSSYEGFGLPPLEAMSCGCPVIASRAASIPETCGSAALYFEEGGPGALAEAIRQLLDDAAEQRRLRALGAERAARFRWADSANLLLSSLAGELQP